jgi:hypothetical protein
MSAFLCGKTTVFGIGYHPLSLSSFGIYDEQNKIAWHNGVPGGEMDKIVLF